MSAAVDVAILSALRANSNLTALLAVQPSGQPAIFQAHKAETPPIYDQVTFRESTKDASQIYAPTWNEDQEYYDFEVWTNSRASGVIDRIRREIDRSLNKRKLTLQDPQFNRMRYMRRMSGGSPTLPDTTLKAYFGLFRYRVWTVGV